MNLIKGSLKYPAIALFFAFVMVAAGIHSLLTMPKTEDPSITIRTGLVIASYPGATSEEVEKQVTKVLEQHILKYKEVYKSETFSTSRPGLAVINVELEENVKDADLFWARLRHEMNETAATELPRGVRGVMVNSDFGDTVAMLIAVHGKPYGYRELRDYADRIQDEMRTVRNVGKTSVYGEQTEQIQINGDLKRMAQYSVTPGKVIQALQARNVNGGSGNFDAESSKVPVKTTGKFTALEDVKNLLVDVSRTGQPLYVKDVADVTRNYEDPDFKIRYDGNPCIMISVEMQKGKNIVQLGDDLSQVFSRLDKVLPPDLKLDLIANQPKVVDDRIKTLTREIILAIISVIVVTIILLPIRVAVIAACAIPITLCATLAIMNMFGIALHQVSIASLIMVLGIVVDDAIVIADNYVDLLDRKVSGEEAGWRSAGEVLIPVLTATVTIVCAFLPMAILTGSVGEFILALPLTVTIALSVSFIVAIFLTPMICRFFIKKGLHSEENTKKKKFSLLDFLQASYGHKMRFFMKYKYLAIGIGVLSFVCGGVLYSMIPQQFFPSAERNQFVIDVWMPQGTRIESTDQTVKKIEKILGATAGVKHYAGFIGQSAPRFYYNVSPQQPDTAYAQFIVNTASPEKTKELVNLLGNTLETKVPEAMAIVKELQQGQQIEAPVEVRISGYDIAELKKAGEQVENIIRKVPYSRYVYNDYMNDSGMVDVKVDNELANRLGVTSYGVANTLGAGLSGQPVSIYNEGDRAIPVVFRLAQNERKDFSDITNAYVTSSVTGTGVSLRSFATLKPQWQTSRIVRRNGVRTITVRAFVKDGYYASALLKTIKPHVADIQLPTGYSVEYGGEEFNQNSTLPQMVGALSISLLAIFIVLLIQFRNIYEPLIVMSAIPLSIMGAMVGLVITGNSYGFTAFMGVISLCGIVVRNSIILIDYIKEKIGEGHGLEQAAMEAGERRLRPIFLTTMAAAVGVTPMIISGSSLWSPLASVLAVGLIFSMFFTLLVVPVLYVMVMGKKSRKSAQTAVICALIVMFGAGSAKAETLHMTLDQVLKDAMENSRVIKIARAKVAEADGKVTVAKSDYYPHLTASAAYSKTFQDNFASIPAGDLGVISSVPLPPTTYNISNNSIGVVYGILAQPVTQLLKIGENVGASESDKKISEADVKKARDEITLAVKSLYFGMLNSMKQQEAFSAAVDAAKEAVKESTDAVHSGSSLDVTVIEAQTALLQNSQYLMAAKNQYENYNADLNNLTGHSQDTVIVPVELAAYSSGIKQEQEYRSTADKLNPEVIAAKETVEKARHGQKAAEYDYIPDVTVFVADVYLDGVPYLNDNTTTVGVKMDWRILDWGKRRGVKAERTAQVLQAAHNMMRVREQTDADVRKAYNRLMQTEQMMDVADKALELAKEKHRINGDRLNAGLISDAVYKQSAAAVKKAEADSLGAKLDHELAVAQMDKIVSE